MRTAAAVAITFVLLAACTGDDEAGITTVAVTSSSAAASTSSAPSTTTLPRIVTTSSTPSTTSAATTTTPTTAANTVPPDLTDPFVPPDDDCPAVDSTAAGADITVLAESVTWQGADAPPCLRVLQRQTVRVNNATDFEVTASIGTEVLLVPPGGSATSVPAGESAQPGEVFDVYIEELDVSITVQVLPNP